MSALWHTSEISYFYLSRTSILAAGIALLSLNSLVWGQAAPGVRNPQPSAAGASSPNVTNPPGGAASPRAGASSPRTDTPATRPALSVWQGADTSGSLKQQLQEQNDVTARTSHELNRDARQEARLQIDAQRNAAATSGAAGSTQSPTQLRAADMGLWFRNEPGSKGLTVTDLSANGVFANAGFREGDIITTMNGQPISSEAQFVQLLSSPNAASQLANIAVLRDGQTQSLAVQPSAVMQGVAAHDPLFQAGLTIDPNNANQAIVQQVFPRTPAFYAGLRPGDIVTTVGGNPIASAAAFSQALQNPGNAALGLQVYRNGQMRQLSLEGEARMQSVLTGNKNPVAAGVDGTATVGANTTNQVDQSGLNTAGSVSAAGGNTIGTTVPGNPAGSSLLPSTSAPLGPTVNPGQLSGTISPATTAQPSLTSGVPRGPGVTGESSAIQGIGTGTPTSQGTLSSSVSGGFSGVPNAGAGQSGAVGGGATLPGGGALPGTTANPATIAQPSLTSGVPRGPGVTGQSSAIQGIGTGTPTSQGTLNSSVPGGFSGTANSGAAAPGTPAAAGATGVRGGTGAKAGGAGAVGGTGAAGTASGAATGAGAGGAGAGGAGAGGAGAGGSGGGAGGGAGGSGGGGAGGS